MYAWYGILLAQKGRQPDVITQFESRACLKIAPENFCYTSVTLTLRHTQCVCTLHMLQCQMLRISKSDATAWCICMESMCYIVLFRCFGYGAHFHNVCMTRQNVL